MIKVDVPKIILTRLSLAPDFLAKETLNIVFVWIQNLDKTAKSYQDVTLNYFFAVSFFT